MKIRVLHVIDHLGYGGAPFVVKSVVERMPAERIESCVCALRCNSRPLPIDADVVTLPGGRYNLAAVRSIAALCRDRRIDIVHAHLQRAIIVSLLAKSRYESRLVLHEHGPVFRGGTGCFYRGLLRLLGRRADAIMANSHAVEAAVRRVMRGSKPSVDVVYNSIDMERFDPDRYDRDEVRASLGLDRDRFVVGFVGRLDRAKGADLLLDAAAILHTAGHDGCFLIVGDGPQRQYLEKRIRRLGLGHAVVLAGLYENTAPVMRAFDVAVVPSRREAFGIAALELMRMRVPVIVSPVGGLPELVQDGDTGIILPRLEPQAIVAAIRRLEQDAPLRGRLSREAFEHAGLFDGGRAISQIAEIYERLMALGQRDGKIQGRVCGI